jgi:hypothetical protein
MSLLKREVCTCGHGGHKHGPKLTRSACQVVLLPGLGTCGVPGCECEKFHFGRWQKVRQKRARKRLVMA